MELSDLVLPGVVALREGQSEAARTEFEAMAKASGQDPMWLREFAEVYSSFGEEEEASAWIKRAEKGEQQWCDDNKKTLTASSDPMMINNYAYQCMAVPGKDLERAISLLKTASQKSQFGSRGVVIDSLGWAYYQQYQQTRNPQDLQNAISELEKAVSLVSPQSNKLLGNYMTTSNFTSNREVRGHLIRAYVDAKAKAPLHKELAHHWAIKDCLGAALTESNRKGATTASRQQAIDLLEEAVYQAPRDPIARYHLGQVYIAEQRPGDASVELSKAVSIEPGYAAAQAALSRLTQKPEPGPSPSPSPAPNKNIDPWQIKSA